MVCILTFIELNATIDFMFLFTSNKITFPLSSCVKSSLSIVHNKYNIIHEWTKIQNPILYRQFLHSKCEYRNHIPSLFIVIFIKII